MKETLIPSANIWLAYLAYVVATASPGPATLAIMGVAMSQGKRASLAFSAGVVSGSFLWACLAVFGVTALIAIHSGLLYLIKVFGGMYLLWLAVNSARSAIKGGHSVTSDSMPQKEATIPLYLHGLALHTTNPKAMLAWVAIVALALPDGAKAIEGFLIIVGCLCLGVLVYGGYALAFSTLPARQLYTKVGRWFDGVVASVFGVAGVKLLLSETHPS